MVGFLMIFKSFPSLKNARTHIMKASKTREDREERLAICTRRQKSKTKGTEVCFDSQPALQAKSNPITPKTLAKPAAVTVSAAQANNKSTTNKEKNENGIKNNQKTGISKNSS